MFLKGCITQIDNKAYVMPFKALSNYPVNMNELYSHQEGLYKHISEIMDQHHPDSSQSSMLTAEIV